MPRMQHPAESRAFHHTVVGVIVLAGVVAGLETSPALVAQHGTLLRWLDLGILSFFIAEAALKMSVHGRRPWRYFADGWNVFDFIILALCLLPVGGPFAAVLRLTRALRLLRLVSALPKLQLLVGALFKSLSAMGYVGLLLTLLFYIYAVAGIHWFGAHDPKNFGSLPTAFLSLFRLVTLDNWADLFSTQLAHVHGAKVALYFVSFIVVGTMIILNLFIGIIMNSMAEMHEEIAARERAQQESSVHERSFEDDLRALEAEAGELQNRLARLRHKWHATQTAPTTRHQLNKLAA